jgi:hypothetical protein
VWPVALLHVNLALLLKAAARLSRLRAFAACPDNMCVLWVVAVCVGHTVGLTWMFVLKRASHPGCLANTVGGMPRVSPLLLLDLCGCRASVGVLWVYPWPGTQGAQHMSSRW